MTVVATAVLAASVQWLSLPAYATEQAQQRREARETRPELPQVARFDTAFHRTHAPLDDLYALPWEYYEAGVRRYGFHGLSYEYVASALPRVAPGIANGRVIVAHLGSGASLCALRAGESRHSANRRGGPCISAPGSAVSASVVPTNEELMIAQHTQQLVA